MTAQDAVYIVFFFIVGSAVGSFLNVVVWRLPRGESIVTPRSRCPKCGHPLAWRDNIPIFGWLILRGRCRYCGEPISPRYPLVEFMAASLFVLYYALFRFAGAGPCLPLDPIEHWPIFGLYLLCLAALLAASLIDAELFIIPVEIPWILGAVAILVHAVVDRPSLPGALNVTAPLVAFSLGGTIGLVASIIAWSRGLIPTSFPKGEPLLEVDRAALLQEIEEKRRGDSTRDVPLGGTPNYFGGELPPEYTPALIRHEITKEMVFLLPPMFLAALSLLLYKVAPVQRFWIAAADWQWLTGLAGALLGAMVGGFMVWLTRIVGTLGFGRVAMGLGDVHLMFGVGAVIGAWPAVVAFFIAPFFGLLIAFYFLITRSRRELPYGPYLSVASAVVILAWCPIWNYLQPGLAGLMLLFSGG